jgi:hypothetical protein
MEGRKDRQTDSCELPPEDFKRLGFVNPKKKLTGPKNDRRKLEKGGG